MKDYLDLDIKVCALLHDTFACSQQYMKDTGKIYALDELVKYNEAKYGVNLINCFKSDIYNK